MPTHSNLCSEFIHVEHLQFHRLHILSFPFKICILHKITNSTFQSIFSFFLLRFSILKGIIQQHCHSLRIHPFIMLIFLIRTFCFAERNQWMNWKRFIARQVDRPQGLQLCRWKMSSEWRAGMSMLCDWWRKMLTSTVKGFNYMHALC